MILTFVQREAVSKCICMAEGGLATSLNAKKSFNNIEIGHKISEHRITSDRPRTNNALKIPAQYKNVCFCTGTNVTHETKRFKIQTLEVWGRAHYLGHEAPHNTEF